MDPIGENAFIIMCGPPQSGKRERISKVRSHITKGYFKRQNQKSKIAFAEQQTRTLVSKPRSLPEFNNALRESAQLIIPPEILYTLPSTNHPMLDPAFLGSESKRRMQKFFEVHMRRNVHSHPFLRSVTTWSVIHPYFMSAKLLNASGWDDVQDSGELSLWTRRQRFITVRLLEEKLKDGSQTHIDATIAAIHSLLGFEILRGGGERYLRLRKFSVSVLDQGIERDDETGIVLNRAVFLLDQSNRLCMASDKNGNLPFHRFSLNYQFSFPVDYALFTFGHHCPLGKNTIIYGLLGDLYNVMSIAECSSENPMAQPTYDYLASLRYNLYQDGSGDFSHEETSSGVSGNIMAAPLRLCIFLLASSLLSGSELRLNQSLSKLVSQLRILLSTSGTGIESHMAWIPFPGALLWCFAIGVRFANPGDKTWFLMQFLRVSHSWVLEKWEETSKSICLIASALDKIHPLFVE